MMAHACNVFIRFECGAEDRMSKEYGPFEYVQLTYRTLTSTDGIEIAVFDIQLGEWVLCDIDGVARKTGVRIDHADAQVTWTDIVIGGSP